MSRRGYYDEKDGFVPYDDVPQNKDFPSWAEELLPQIIKPNVKALAIITIDDDDEIHSAYYNCSLADKQLMQTLFSSDYVIDVIRINRDEIIDILNGEDDE